MWALRQRWAAFLSNNYSHGVSRLDPGGLIQGHRIIIYEINYMRGGGGERWFELLTLLRQSLVDKKEYCVELA